MFKKREKKACTFIIGEDETQEKNYDSRDSPRNLNYNYSESLLSNKTIRSIDDDLSKLKNFETDNGAIKKKKGSEGATFSTNNKHTQNGEFEENSVFSDLRYRSSYQLQNPNYATRENEIDTEKDKDAMSIMKRNMQISKDILAGKLETNVYKGSNANVIYMEKSEKDLSRYKVTGSFGPMRAPSNVRVTCRFDYAQGICKDYKETGRCGFGDGCVFMHDRGDYKTGWELEEEWKKEQINKERLMREGNYKENESEDEEYVLNKQVELPLICPICEEDFKSPIVTECQHFFCESCATKNYQKSPICYLCKKKVNGIFNNASDLITKIQERKQKLKNKEKLGPIKKTSDHQCDCKTNNCIGGEKCKLNKFKYELELEEDENDDEIEEIKEKSELKKNRNNFRNSNLNFTKEDFEFDFKEVEKKKNKRNNFRIQNGWMYPSDFDKY